MNAADRGILDHFIRTRKKTMELLKQVPEDWLTKKADGEDMTLGRQFMHIATGPNWWLNYCMQDVEITEEVYLKWKNL